MKRTITIALVALLAAAAATAIALTLTAGTAKVHHRRAPAAHAAPQVRPACVPVLAVIPASPPSTARQAEVLVHALSSDQGVLAGMPRGSLLYALGGDVGDDALRLAFTSASARQRSMASPLAGVMSRWT